MVSTTSNYISKIQQNYPAAGEDNDSQGFRDNFKNIALALNSANTDINTLHLGSVSLIKTNNFNNNVIQQAVFQDCAVLSLDNSTVVADGDVVIDYRAGSYQKFQVSGGTHQFTVENWPGSNMAGSMIVSVTTSSTATTYIDFGATNLINLGSNTLPVAASKTGPSVFELWNDGDAGTLYVKELGSSAVTQSLSATSVGQTNVTTATAVTLVQQVISTQGTEPLLIWTSCLVAGAHITTNTLHDYTIDGIFWNNNANNAGVTLTVDFVDSTNPSTIVTSTTMTYAVSVIKGQSTQVAAQTAISVDRIPAGTYVARMRAQSTGPEAVSARSSTLTILETRR